MINFIFTKFERFLYRRQWLNLFATIYINFRTLPFSKAIRFPIYVYGRIEFVSLGGKIEINTHSIKRGMIKLGRHRDDYCLRHRRSILYLDKKATIIFQGKCSVGNDFLLRVTGSGVLSIGNYAWIGSNVNIYCFNSICIGDYTSLTFNCTLMDSNCHYTYDIISKEVNPILGSINLGKNNWIGNYSTIMKGCITDDYTNVASHSLLNKNYKSIYGPNILLAGSPASIKKKNIRRIFSGETESSLNEAFKESEKIILPQDFFDNLLDLEQYFK